MSEVLRKLSQSCIKLFPDYINAPVSSYVQNAVNIFQMTSLSPQPQTHVGKWTGEGNDKWAVILKLSEEEE